MFSPNDHYIYSSGIDGGLYEWNTLNFNRRLNGGGGISDLSFSLSARITDKEKGALKFSYLFGNAD